MYYETLNMLKHKTKFWYKLTIIDTSGAIVEILVILIFTIKIVNKYPLTEHLINIHNTVSPRNTVQTCYVQLNLTKQTNWKNTELLQYSWQRNNLYANPFTVNKNNDLDVSHNCLATINIKENQLIWQQREQYIFYETMFS